MSYLNALRLHFSGRFQANVSTVNNDPGHFQNDAFEPSYQEMQTHSSMNGWFNPQGDGGWRLMGCKVTSAFTSEGAVSDDPVLDDLIADSDGRVCGKLVDLDPEQQLVSEIWGLQVRICDSAGETLMCGNFEVAAFMDIWDRATQGGGGDIGAGAMYQSVLKDLEWGDVSGSPFLTQLKAAASNGLLSIKFNVDGLNMEYTSPDFMSGRIVGTIGPAGSDEPIHMLIGRQFMATHALKENFFTPKGGINFFPAVVDTDSKSIYLDLGNALPTTTPGGPLVDLGDLTLAVCDSTSQSSDFNQCQALGTIPSTGTDGYASNASWYADTAGIVILPLTDAQLQAISNKPLALYAKSTQDAQPKYYIYEPDCGTFVRADTYVYRLSPGDTQDLSLIATQFGNLLSDVEVTFEADDQQLQPGNYVNPHDVPQVATPLSALGDISTKASTNPNGVAVIPLQVSDPGQPRNFSTGHSYGIDGQVYGLRPKFTDDSLNPDKALENRWNFVSILLWSGYEQPTDPTWDDVEPVFQQAANLYPVMNRFLNLADFDSVKSNAGLLKLAFGLPVDNPNYMPVTRDLSPAKKQTILKWLDNPLPSTGGAQKSAKASAAAAASLTASQQGGKSAAAARRLCKQ